MIATPTSMPHPPTQRTFPGVVVLQLRQRVQLTHLHVPSLGWEAWQLRQSLWNQREQTEHWTHPSPREQMWQVMQEGHVKGREGEGEGEELPSMQKPWKTWQHTTHRFICSGKT